MEQHAEQQRGRVGGGAGPTDGSPDSLGGGGGEIDPDGLMLLDADFARRRFDDGQATVRYLVTSDHGYRKELSFLLLGPYGREHGEERGER